MSRSSNQIKIAESVQKPGETEVDGGYVTLLGELYYRIQNYDAMPPFFMSIVSSSDHWLFVATTGGLTAGRINADHALFPYYTVDRITEDQDNTGSKTILLVSRAGTTALWEPFSNHYQGLYQLERHLYKNVAGTAIVFEEVNHDLNLVFRYAWRTSEAFGLVKTAWLSNRGSEAVQVNVLDGLQNILPAHVQADVQNQLSVLMDAYKRSELHPATGIGLFSLSSRLTDMAEPSEALRANIAWQVGLDQATYLLSSEQLQYFRLGQGIQPETDVRGQRGAYFVNSTFELSPDWERSWHIICEVDQDSSAVVALIQQIQQNAAKLYQTVEQDIQANTQKLTSIIGSADGLQTSGDSLSTAHHFANVLFNVMRGGIIADQNHIETQDLQAYVAVHNHALSHAEFFATLPATLTIDELKERADAQDNLDLRRLCYAYLPLTFSRRHGDPSRPWNRFSIQVKNPDGSRQLNYQGNWRDIFQNWEALAYAYPAFIEGMIGNFLNATTVDGYNPYRITRQGIDWEVPEPNNPWANIGYWSDHQIIYLQKLMEVCARFYPGKLEDWLTHPTFAYANVPYRIKPYAELVQDPYHTIAFDWELHQQIEARVHERGADGKLVLDAEGRVLHSNLTEKLLSLLLAKLVNFVPEGGIWMNTQRPEWNDANNALVGKGMSVVTLGYLLRYVTGFKQLLQTSAITEFTLTQEIYDLLISLQQVFESQQAILQDGVSDVQRRTMMDALGQAGSDFRWNYYQHGMSGKLATANSANLIQFLTLVQAYIEHSLRANKRPDDLYHAYNTLSLSDNRAEIKYLDVMLEGQVAILSSGLLTPQEALSLLQNLRQSALYRADQHSYILYPDRRLPGFLEKNNLSAADVRDLSLVHTLLAENDTRLMLQDVNGIYHFNGDLRNAHDVERILATLAKQARYQELVRQDSKAILALFERVFNHQAFTGRSGSFFAYEGLGSIYWHMISKLLLAAQETTCAAIHAPVETLQALVAAYEDIRAGLGFNKSPQVYGAFPTDPYSHTPLGQGAKQPGMTGMVKEEILTRMAELGLFVEQGEIRFDPILLRTQELLSQPSLLQYLDIDGHPQQITLPAQSLGYTFCQVPIVLQAATEPKIELRLKDSSTHVVSGHCLDAEISHHIFWRDGWIRQITVSMPL